MMLEEQQDRWNAAAAAKMQAAIEENAKLAAGVGLEMAMRAEAWKARNRRGEFPTCAVSRERQMANKARRMAVSEFIAKHPGGTTMPEISAQIPGIKESDLQWLRVRKHFHVVRSHDGQGKFSYTYFPGPRDGK